MRRRRREMTKKFLATSAELPDEASVPDWWRSMVTVQWGPEAGHFVCPVAVARDEITGELIAAALRLLAEISSGQLVADAANEVMSDEARLAAVLQVREEVERRCR